MRDLIAKIRGGRMLEVIKLVHEQTGRGLAESSFTHQPSASRARIVQQPPPFGGQRVAG